MFCVNQGTLEERLKVFEDAVRRVYASIMDISALEYRKQRGLEHRDEQMAVLVQRVSGSHWGDYFFPAAAGVGYSYSAYKWSKDMDQSAGMLRLVAGLGTRAVDRTENDYPRLVNLDRPAVSMQTNVADKHRFSQKNMDVLDTKENRLLTKSTDSLMEILPLWYKRAIMERDYEAEEALNRMGRWRQVWFVTCQKLLENREFTGLMQKLLKTLEQVYGNPVDIEYTVNIDEEGAFVVNLLQCRPLFTGSRGGKVEIPGLPKEKTFFHLKDSSVGNSLKKQIHVVIQIEPKLYYEYPYGKKHQVAEAVGKINRYYKGSGKNILLMTPGRVGTSSPELGVPVTFADISAVCGICEVSDSRAGYMPELSYGSHMFQDMVEAEIFYSALWEDKRKLAYDPELFAEEENLFPRICPDMEELFPMFRVTQPENLYYWNDVMSGETLCGIAES